MALVKTVLPSSALVAFVNAVVAAVTALLSLVSFVPLAIACAAFNASSRDALFVAAL